MSASDLETEVRVLKKYLKHLAEKPQDVYPMNCIDVIFHEWARKTEKGRAHRKEAVDALLKCKEESHERKSSHKPTQIYRWICQNFETSHQEARNERNTYGEFERYLRRREVFLSARTASFSVEKSEETCFHEKRQSKRETTR